MLSWVWWVLPDVWLFGVLIVDAVGVLDICGWPPSEMAAAGYSAPSVIRAYFCVDVVERGRRWSELR